MTLISVGHLYLFVIELFVNIISISTSSILYLILLPLYIGHEVICFAKRLIAGKQAHKPRSILITGASGGIGESLAYAYAKRGVHLIITGRNEERLNRVSEKCVEKGARVSVYRVDVTDRKAMNEIIERQEFLDLVIANAGVSEFTVLNTRDKETLQKICQAHEFPVEEEDVMREIIDINQTGVLNTVYPAIRYFLKHNCGNISQIAIVSSIAGTTPTFTGIYGCVKNFITNLSYLLRRQYASNNIRVNAILPGWVDTDMAKAFPGEKTMMITSKDAASLIVKGLERDEPTISFPFIPRFFGDIISRLPVAYSLAFQSFVKDRTFVKETITDKFLNKSC